MLIQEINDSLVKGEFGDVRSYLDEHDPKGQTDTKMLNMVNSSAEWHFDANDGWSYTEMGEH